MPAQPTTRLCGLLLSLALTAVSVPARAETVLPPAAVSQPAAATRSPAGTAPQQPATATAALQYSQADSAWICTAAGERWNCRPGLEVIKPHTSVSLHADPADRRYRDSYSNGYASKATVLSTQQQARQQWQKTERQPSNPEGIDQADSLFAEAPFAFLDWYPNPTGISPLSHCAGSYIQPQFEFSDAALDPSQQPATISAEYSRTLNDSVTELYGDIDLRKGNSQAHGQRARLNHRSEQAELSQLIQIREPGLLLLGDRAEINMQTNETTIDQAQFVLHSRQLRGSAERIIRRGDDLFIYQGAYTRCEPGNQSWSLNGSEIVLHQESGLGEVTHATLRLSDVPVFYIPYMTFPITRDRMSGLLFPKLAFTSAGGIDYTQPYYFNLAPNYDDTLTLRHIGNRGDMVENEFRYLDNWGRLQLGFAYLPGDADRNDNDRWLLGIDHSGSPAAHWSTGIDYTAVSDSDYFDDLGTNLDLSKQSHLDKIAELGYRGKNLIFAAQLHDYQTIDAAAERPYRKLPALRLSGTPQLEVDRLQVDLLSDLTHFDRDPTGFVGSDRTSGVRTHLESTLAMRFNRPWGFLRPAVKLTHTRYDLYNQPNSSNDTPSRTLPLLSLDSGLFFDREFSFDERPYIQTLEPRLFLLDVPFTDQDDLPNFDSSELTFSFNQLFRDNRFSGFDRIGDTRQATLGLTSRLIDSDGHERGNVSIGQILYFKDRQVRLDSTAPLTEDRSNLVAEALWNVTDRFRLSGNAEWNRNANDNLVRNLKLSYQSDIDHLINLGYRFTEGELEQTDLSAIWPLSPQWSMLGRWQRDLAGHESQDLIVGLEYESCCWRIRTTYRQWLTDDTEERVKEGIFVQFILKGLGGVDTKPAGDNGSSAKHFLKDITGFEERNDEY